MVFVAVPVKFSRKMVRTELLLTGGPELGHPSKVNIRDSYIRIIKGGHSTRGMPWP